MDRDCGVLNEKELIMNLRCTLTRESNLLVSLLGICLTKDTEAINDLEKCSGGKDCCEKPSFLDQVQEQYSLVNKSYNAFMEEAQKVYKSTQEKKDLTTIKIFHRELMKSVRKNCFAKIK